MNHYLGQTHQHEDKRTPQASLWKGYWKAQVGMDTIRLIRKFQSRWISLAATVAWVLAAKALWEVAKRKQTSWKFSYSLPKGMWETLKLIGRFNGLMSPNFSFLAIRLDAETIGSTSDDLGVLKRCWVFLSCFQFHIFNQFRFSCLIKKGYICLVIFWKSIVKEVKRWRIIFIRS